MTTGENKRTGHVWAPPADHNYSEVPVVRFEDGTYGCARPPVPWKCSREPAHEGPCAASRDPKVSMKGELAEFTTYTDPQPMFSLYKEQRDVAHEWMKRHDAERHVLAGKKHRYSGAIGGAYTWKFTPTSLGTAVSVHCSCGEHINITDYDNW